MGKKLNKFVKQMLEAGMPMKAISELTDLYLDQDFTGVVEIKVKEDPYVAGTFAVRIVQKLEQYYRHDNVEGSVEYLNDLDLLWNNGAYDEVEFQTWPPTSGPNNRLFFSNRSKTLNMERAVKPLTREQRIKVYNKAKNLYKKQAASEVKRGCRIVSGMCDILLFAMQDLKYAYRPLNRKNFPEYFSFKPKTS